MDLHDIGLAGETVTVEFANRSGAPHVCQGHCPAVPRKPGKPERAGYSDED